MHQSDAPGRRAKMRRSRLVVIALTAVAVVSCTTNNAEQAKPQATSSPSSAAAPTSEHHHTHQPAGLSLKTNSPAGDITMPGHVHAHAGMEMASSEACNTIPTPAEQLAAVDLVNRSWAGARQYESLDAARADGYRPVTPVGQQVVHYINSDYYVNTMLGGTALNTSHPQSLVYANTSKGAVLVAVMFMAAFWGETPQPGGCLTQWHVHTNLCINRSLEVVGDTDTGCPPGSANRPTPPMLHIWFVPVPGGPTAVDASDADTVAAAEKVAAPPNGVA